uniref:Tetraspanin n=1 Tax=Oryzias sinensis TaxID=183150 RepID=A0A8C7XA36_9TELE
MGNGKDAATSDAEFTFVSPVVKYLLFVFNFIFWVISFVMVGIGVYARLIKQAETALACLTVDPAVMLMVVGIFMFIVTFCGCVGSLRENICLLQTARGKVTEVINKSIIHYRDDVDLQNLIDYGQKEFRCCGGEAFTDWSQNIYFNCSEKNPSRERCSVPFSCCIITKVKELFNSMCGEGMQKLDYITAGQYVYTDGCIDKLVNWIHSNLFIIGGIALGLAIPQLVGILLSQILINQIKDQIELQNYNARHRSDPWS